jgi:purine-cytosine permease-like protein
MTKENNLAMTELTQENTVKIYSKKAILAFSIFFAPIFGGVLLRQNLIDNKRKKEANIVLLASIAFTVLTILIVNSFEKQTSSLTYLLNMGGGAILSEYFFKKYFPDDNYEYKRIWKALLISIAIIIPLLLAMIYAPTE